MSLSAFDKWFFAARDEENKIDGVGVPVGTTLLYKFCHNDVKAFEGACALLERAFNAGGAHAVPPNWLPTAENINALPEPLRRYIHDMVSNADPAGTVRELTIAQDTIRALEASNRILRDQVAGFEAQGVPDGWREFVQRVAGQKPEKPDYWSACGQCERNISDAEDLLASAPPAPQASVVQQEPLGFISPKQVERIVDPDGESGAYIPMRKTPAGNFTLAVYTHPAQHAKPQPLSEDVLLAAWNESAVCRGSLGSRRQAFVEGARFVESRLGVEGAQ